MDAEATTQVFCDAQIVLLGILDEIDIMQRRSSENECQYINKQEA